MIDVQRLLESFQKLEEAGVDLKDCVVFDNPDPKTAFIVMQKKDLPDDMPV